MKEYIRCLRCGRKLKSEESKQRGFGNICWEKYNNSIKYKELFTMDIKTDSENYNSSMLDLSNNKSV